MSICWRFTDPVFTAETVFQYCWSQDLKGLILKDGTFKKYSNSKGMNVIVNDAVESFPANFMVHHLVIFYHNCNAINF